MTANKFLWLAAGIIELLLGLFILTDLYDKLIDYVAYALIVLGALVILLTVTHMFGLWGKRE